MRLNCYIRLAMVVLLVAVFAGPSWCGIEKSDHDMAGEKGRDLLVRLIHSDVGLPDRLSTRSDAYLLVRVYATRTYLTLYARPETDPQQLADKLNKALTHIGKPPIRIVWSQNEFYTCAGTVVWSPGELWAQRVTSKVPIGRVVDNLHSNGLDVHTAVRVDDSVQTSLGKPDYISPKSKFRWYALKHLPSDGTIITQEEIPTPDYVRAVLFAWLIPTVCILASIIAVWLGRREDIEIERRHKLYHKFIVWPVMLSVLVFIIILKQLIVPDRAYTIVGVWFGPDLDAFTKWARETMMISALSPALTLLGSMVFQKRLVGPPEGDPPAERRTPAEGGITYRGLWFGFLAAIITVCVTVLFTDGIWHDRLKAFSKIGVFICWWAFTAISMRLAGERRNILSAKPVDPDVERRIRYIASKLGMQVSSVEEKRLPLSLLVQIRQKTSSIFLNRRLTDGLSPEEIEFTVAREVAEIENPVPGPWLPKVFIGVFIIAMCAIYIGVIGSLVYFFIHPNFDRAMSGKETATVFISIASFFLILILVSIFDSPRRKKQEYQSTRMALEFTRNVEVAESAFRKINGLQRRSQAGMYGGDDWKSDLARAAEEIGLPEPGESGPQE